MRYLTLLPVNDSAVLPHQIAAWEAVQISRQTTAIVAHVELL